MNEKGEQWLTDLGDTYAVHVLHVTFNSEGESQFDGVNRGVHVVHQA